MPFRLVDIDEDNDTEDDEDEEREDDSNLRIKVNYTEGTADAIKTADKMGLVKKKVMKLDFYIERDSMMEGLDEDKEGDKEIKTDDA